MVLNAVVAFKIANIFESAPKLAKENKVNGIALFKIAKIALVASIPLFGFLDFIFNH